MKNHVVFSTIPVVITLLLSGCSGKASKEIPSADFAVEKDSAVSAAMAPYQPEETYNSDIYTSYQAQANDYMNCFFDGNLSEVIKYYPPEEIKASGGKDSILMQLKLVSAYIGSRVKDYEISRPDKIYPIGTKLAGVSKVDIVFALKKGGMDELHHWILGISENQGKDWYFTKPSLSTIKRYLPAFNNEFSFPEIKY